MSKIAKGDNPVFLAIIQETNEAPPRKKAQEKTLFQLLKENNKFSIVFLYVTGNN